MGIEIPDRWMGKPVEGSLERIMVKSPQAVTTSPSQSQRQIIVPTNINPRDYIIVPQYNVLIAKSETHKGKNYDETLDALAQEGLMMPTITQFMRHWMNVKDAVVDGINVLLYADKTSVPVQEAEDLWKYMSSGHRGGCYTWLNARFSENGGNWKMIQEYRGTPLQKLEIPFNCSVRENGLVALEFNNEGFPERRSGLNSYSAGKNIFFYDPRDGRVARFSAYSVSASLYCGGDAGNRDASLGVFACAAGVAPKNSGGFSP